MGLRAIFVPAGAMLSGAREGPDAGLGLGHLEIS